MTKRGPPRATKKKLAGVCKAQPFGGEEKDLPNRRSMKSKQKGWLLDGLRAIKAPVAPR